MELVCANCLKNVNVISTSNFFAFGGLQYVTPIDRAGKDECYASIEVYLLSTSCFTFCKRL